MYICCFKSRSLIPVLPLKWGQRSIYIPRSRPNTRHANASRKPHAPPSAHPKPTAKTLSPTTQAPAQSACRRIRLREHPTPQGCLRYAISARSVIRPSRCTNAWTQHNVCRVSRPRRGDNGSDASGLTNLPRTDFLSASGQAVRRPYTRRRCERPSCVWYHASGV